MLAIAMALVNVPPNDRKRVKVYELRNNDWFDRGTGFCTGQVVNVRGTSSRVEVPRETSIVTSHSPGFNSRVALAC